MHVRALLEDDGVHWGAAECLKEGFGNIALVAGIVAHFPPVPVVRHNLGW